RYYVVKPVSQLAVDSLFETELDADEDGAVHRDEEGNEITRLVPQFPMSWMKKHFENPTEFYLTKEEAMSEEDLICFERLRSYVHSFKPTRYVTKAGGPALDSSGRPRVEQRFVNTKALLEYNMADFAEELLKIAADQKGPERGKKKVKSRDSVVLEQSGPGGSSSPGGVSSSQAGVQSGSSVVRQPPPKRPIEDPVIDVDALERPYPLPRCFSSRDFMEKRPPMVADVEKAVILDMGPAARQEELARDAAVMIRLLETALILNDEQGNSTREVEKLKARNEKLEAKALKWDSELIDLRGKQENFVAQVKELRETREALDKAKKGLGES
ncbi:hypothetical protein A2U01_0005308, partial [Trifolium medium]|nr:hypothetical protein [Trifolium medium]